MSREVVQATEIERRDGRVAEATPRATRVGLVVPRPPQIGGVTSVGEWLIQNADSIGCTYDVFDLRRPSGAGSGGRVTLSTLRTQVALLARFLVWAARAPDTVHYCASCTSSGLLRDTVYLLILRTRRCACLVHIHGSDLDDALVSAFRRRLLSITARAAAEVVAVSSKPAAALRLAGIEARFIYNPVLVDPRPAARPTTARPGLRLLFVGAYGARKGVPELVRAVAAARALGADAVLRIVGPPDHPDEEERLEALIAATGVADAVDVSGPLDRGCLAAAYSEADALCLPSYREGLPMAILEAMTFGLPVVATRVGGIPDLVEDGDSGILVDPGDADALRDAILTLVADPTRRAALGRRARRRVADVAGNELLVREWQHAYARARARRCY